jgi:hypothetical protein
MVFRGWRSYFWKKLGPVCIFPLKTGDVDKFRICRLILCHFSENALVLFFTLVGINGPRIDV